MSAPMPVPPDKSGPQGLESWMYGAIGIFVVVLAVIVDDEDSMLMRLIPPLENWSY